MLIRDITWRERLPQKFLEAILLKLKSAGILHSRPGRGGGYTLNRSRNTIARGRVIRLIVGPLAPIPRVRQTAYAPRRDRLDEKTCTIRLVMKQVRDATAAILDATTFTDLLGQQSRLAEGREGLDFSI